MSEQYLGEIRIVGFNFAPKGWALAQGQLLSLTQNQALFSLYGTYYGGDGRTTFGIPDFRGRFPVHVGQGSGLSPYVIGQVSGTENVTLLNGNIPVHTHPASMSVAIPANTNTATDATPGPSLMLGQINDTSGAASPTEYVALVPANKTTLTPFNQTITVTPAGANPVALRNPFMCMNFIVALTGIYPSRS